jgi:hypothetical protein
LIEGISYSRIKHITDWMLTEETQRRALAQVVNAISRLDITPKRGGKVEHQAVMDSDSP